MFWDKNGLVPGDGPDIIGIASPGETPPIVDVGVMLGVAKGSWDVIVETPFKLLYGATTYSIHKVTGSAAHQKDAMKFKQGVVNIVELHKDGKLWSTIRNDFLSAPQTIVDSYSEGRPFEAGEELGVKWAEIALFADAGFNIANGAKGFTPGMDAVVLATGEVFPVATRTAIATSSGSELLVDFSLTMMSEGAKNSNSHGDEWIRSTTGLE